MMATTKSTTPRSRTAKPRASRPENTSLAARTGRTVKERPYTSAAIATGAVTAVAAAAAGAYFFSRRDKSFKEASEELTSRVKDGLASASGKVKDLGQRGAEYFKGDSVGTETRSQQEIAEEALTLKETGVAKSPIDTVSATEIKTGAIAY
ncbi:MAG: hypothetical protein M3Q57_02055 [Pseudomonadota bacterium]|jgi:hypothetical protein|nr:hypothetical protein [Pseudomonadota bacterium]